MIYKTFYTCFLVAAFSMASHSIASAQIITKEGYQFLSDFLSKSISEKSFHMDPYMNIVHFRGSDAGEYYKTLKGKISRQALTEILQNAKKQYAKFNSSNNRFDKTQFKVPGMKLRLFKYDPSKIRWYYVCSYPVFDNQKQYAVIDLGQARHGLAGRGRKLLLKKVNKKWVVLAWFDEWVS